MLDARLPHLPGDWDVWAFTDPHGVTSGLRAALHEAGLIDDDGQWVAPPRTALIGCGDYIDRGGDIAGTIALLRRLQLEAAKAGSAVLLARGNHEVMPLMIRHGRHEWLETWLEYGGRATVAAYGCAEAEAHDPERAMTRLERCAPGLFDWFGSLPQAVRWRDILFVHGGLAPGHGPADLGVSTDEHLWVRSGFFDTPWEAGDFDAYRAAGIERVVFGHTPQWTGPTFYHEGRSLGIDTNAVGNPRMPRGSVQELTLLGLHGTGTFDDARFVRVPTADAPDALRPDRPHETSAEPP
ncbi:MAG: metallophosphoesterase [Chloroflexota bacterium]|jgi:hypothetical protein